MLSPVALVIISAFMDGLIAAGSVLLGGGIEAGFQGGASKIPSMWVWVASGVTGIVAFAKEIKQRITDARKP